MKEQSALYQTTLMKQVLSCQVLLLSKEIPLSNRGEPGAAHLTTKVTWNSMDGIMHGGVEARQAGSPLMDMIVVPVLSAW